MKSRIWIWAAGILLTTLIVHGSGAAPDGRDAEIAQLRMEIAAMRAAATKPAITPKEKP